MSVMLACSSTSTPPNGGGTDPSPEPQPELPLGYDPSYQLEYVSLDQMGLPRGQCVEVGVQNYWRGSMAHESMRTCTPSEVAGAACSNVGSHCKINNLQALSCRAETTHRCHGWLFEETKAESGPSSFKPLEGAEVFIFFFPYNTNPASDIVLTDENGYFELYTTTLNNTLRLRKDGYFGACNGNTVWPFAGQVVRQQGNPEPVIGPFKMLKLEPDSCQGVVGLMSEPVDEKCLVPDLDSEGNTVLINMCDEQ